MRQLRLMSREELLIREAVRVLLAETDARPEETRRAARQAARDIDAAVQQKIKDLDLPQQKFFDGLLSAVGIGSDAAGLGANWIAEWAPANMPADLVSLGVAWISYAASEDRLSRTKDILAGNPRVSDEERAAIIQTYDDFAAMQGLLFAATVVSTIFSVADFFGIKLAGVVELSIKVAKGVFSVLNILDELTGNTGSTETYRKMKSVLASAHTELLPLGGVTQIAQAVKSSFNGAPAAMTSVTRSLSLLAPNTDEQDVKRLVTRMKTIDTWAKDFNRRISA